MKISDRGQVTIPKAIREQFGLRTGMDVEFRIVNGAILLARVPKKLDSLKWKGRCKDSFAELGYTGSGAVDRFIDDVRGR